MMFPSFALFQYIFSHCFETVASDETTTISSFIEKCEAMKRKLMESNEKLQRLNMSHTMQYVT